MNKKPTKPKSLSDAELIKKYGDMKSPNFEKIVKKMVSEPSVDYKRGNIVDKKLDKKKP